MDQVEDIRDNARKAAMRKSRNLLIAKGRVTSEKEWAERRAAHPDVLKRLNEVLGSPDAEDI